MDEALRVETDCPATVPVAAEDTIEVEVDDPADYVFAFESKAGPGEYVSTWTHSELKVTTDADLALPFRSLDAVRYWLQEQPTAVRTQFSEKLDRFRLVRLRSRGPSLPLSDGQGPAADSSIRLGLQQGSMRDVEAEVKTRAKRKGGGDA